MVYAALRRINTGQGIVYANLHKVYMQVYTLLTQDHNEFTLVDAEYTPF